MKAESKSVKYFFFDEEATEKTEKLHQIDYVVIPLLPEEQRKTFDNWLQKIDDIVYPLIPEESIYQFDCAFYNDYEKWYESWNKA